MLDLNNIPPLPRNQNDDDELLERLRERAGEWVPALLPRGRRSLDGREWRTADISGRPPRKEGSCKINLEGDNAGDWCDFSTGGKGGPFSTIKEATGLSGGALMERVREYAGMPLRQPRRRAEPRDNVDRQRDIAFILKCCAPAPGTLVETYLNSRGLDLPATEDIKYHSMLTDWATKTGRPGMVSIVRRPDTGEPTGGIHRTYLAEDGLAKADMEKPKMMLGPCEGGVVMLMPMSADGSVAIAEGIESSLAAHKLFGVPTWAALSTSGMRSFVFPPGLKRLAIFADHGEGGLSAAWHLHQRAGLHGIEATVNLPRSDDDFAKDLELGLWAPGAAPAQEVIPPPRSLNDLIAAAQTLTRPPDPIVLANLLRAIAFAKPNTIDRGQVFSVIKRKAGIGVGELGEMLKDARREVGALARQVNGPPPAWADKIILWENGESKPMLANALIPLREDEALSNLIGHDEFSEAPALCRRPPYDCGERPMDDFPQVWTQDDTLRLTEWMQARGLNVTKEIVKQAIVAISREKYVHPVRDWLDDLEWDGVKRIDQWLQTHVGAADTKYTRAIGSRYLISAVARIYNPGCKVDCALILEGDQGIGKSSLLRALFDPWFTDEVADLGSKDAALQLRGVWGIELAELDALDRSEVRRIKSWISRTDDHYRPPYGETVIDVKRQCVFCGSTNEGEYLRDPSGGRRFWPVKCAVKRIEIKQFYQVREQLWAEAVTCYRRNERFDIYEPDLLEATAEAQAERYEGDVWDPLIADYLRRRFPPHGWQPADDEHDFIVTGEILEHAIGLDKDRWTDREKRRVTKFLRKEGWEKNQQRQGMIRVWGHRKRRAKPD